MTQNNKTEMDDLFSGLKTSHKVATDILELLKEENKAIRKMSTQTLLRLAKQKENLLAKIHYMDNRIKELISNIMKSRVSRQPRDISKPPETSSKLADMIPLLPENEGRILQQFYSKLSQLRQDIYTNNHINKRLISDTLLCINDGIALITEPPQKNKIYGNRGISQYTSNNPSMISREV